jgi:hypothetical protein
MKAIKKYDEGGDLPLNKIHLAKIKKKAKEAYDRGDKEKGDKLTARAEKKEARQKKWKDRIDRFVAHQEEMERKHERMNRGEMGSLEKMIEDLDRFVSEKQRQTTTPATTRKQATSKSKSATKARATKS